MKDFAGRIAVVTGGGTGMGRELVRQLVAEGCHVAMCDVAADTMAETQALCAADGLPQGLRVTAHLADVSDEAQMQRFRDEVSAQHQTECVHLLFNNAGVGGGGSLFTNSRAQWERTFNICRGGVYFGVLSFLPMMMKADAAHIVNTSSVNGFWASIGPETSHTAYSAAKFAVKGFSEALMTDLRLNAPHIKCSVVMPGHIGTSIIFNSRRVHNNGVDGAISAAELKNIRSRLARMGVNVDAMNDEQVAQAGAMIAAAFRDNAPMSAAEAAKVILDGVRDERWRILVGADAEELDRRVRADPENAYSREFYDKFNSEIGWRLG